MTDRGIQVEMLNGTCPVIRFSFATATQISGKTDEHDEYLAGRLSVMLQSLEDAKTLRDSLSAFITFQERVGVA